MEAEEARLGNAAVQAWRDFVFTVPTTVDGAHAFACHMASEIQQGRIPDHEELVYAFGGLMEFLATLLPDTVPVA